MPGLPLKHHRPRVYLDWSHLTRAACPASQADCRLRDAVERTGDETNLIISDYHVWEMQDHGDRDRALQAAAWLDSIPYVWLICDRERVSTFEATQCLRRLSSLALCPDAELFTPSTTVALAGKYSVEVQSEVLGKTLQEIVAVTHGSQRQAMDRLKDAILEWIYRLERDERGRKAALGMGQRRERWSDNRFLEGLAASALHRGRVELYRQGWESCSVEQALAKLRGGYDLSDFRCMRLQDVALRVVADHIQSISAQGSLAMDLEHLVGAAYCDLFTCDQMMRNVLDHVHRRWPGLQLASTLLVGSADKVARLLTTFLGRVA